MNLQPRRLSSPTLLHSTPSPHLSPRGTHERYLLMAAAWNFLLFYNVHVCFFPFFYLSGFLSFIPNSRRRRLLRCRLNGIKKKKHNFLSFFQMHEGRNIQDFKTLARLFIKQKERRKKKHAMMNLHEQVELFFPLLSYPSVIPHSSSLSCSPYEHHKKRIQKRKRNGETPL